GVELGSGTKFIVKAGASATVNGNISIAITDNAALAEVTVETGATLKTYGGQYFKNCNLVLNGGLQTTTEGHLVFGYALPGETARFSMTATGATIATEHPVSVTAENAYRIGFVVPAVCGAVEVDGTITLKDTTFGYNSLDGFAFGLGNPEDKEFEVVADNTNLDIGGETYVAGGAHLTLTNNSILTRKRHSEGDTSDSMYNINVQDLGKVTLRDGGTIKAGITRINGDLKNGVISLKPSVEGYVGLEVLEGGVTQWYKSNGLRGDSGYPGTIKYAGGSAELFRGYYWAWGNRAQVFNNFAAVEVADETTMTIRGVTSDFNGGGRANMLLELETPFTGGGDIRVENNREDTLLQPVVIRGDNANTGTISVADAAENGNRKSLLHFANGANWAGTVVWRNMDLIYSADSTSGNDSGPKVITDTPASVVFGTLELVDDFPVKVWRDESGNLVCDQVTADSFTGSGRIVPEAQWEVEDGDEPFEVGTKLYIGKIKKGSALPKVARRWAATREPIVDENGEDVGGDYDNLVLVASQGLVIFIR
ncbi:MAG: hypothetical protein IJ802_01015, partial [Kiritimatiellae bacterium]|nr:hypothetical protein [Kiritimatiellia bacterium]